MVSELINKYIWLINTLLNAGTHGLALKEIQSRWEYRWDCKYARRTFYNHTEAIYNIFGIKVECNRSTNRYLLKYADEVDDTRSNTEWLINTFTVNNLLELRNSRLSGRVAVENIPSGHKYLTSIIETMERNCKVMIEYLKYDRDEAEEVNVLPYALKEDSKRWYLVGYCEERKGIRVYSLDRIKNLTILEKRFQMPEGFDIDNLMGRSYGIYLTDPNQKAETVILECSPNQMKYFKDLPIHFSQTTELNGDKGIVKFRAVPNPKMIMDLCALGDRIKILSPASVQEAVINEHKKALTQYQDMISQ